MKSEAENGIDRHVKDQTSGDPTLHQRILGDIEGRIMSGEWPPGYRLPFEIDLARDYACSRMTVNKVMTQLAKSGLIERRKKSGSFVTQPRAQSAVLEIHDIETEVRSLNLPYAFTMEHRTVRKATASDVAHFDIDRGTPLLDTTCIHFAGKRRFCLEQRLISLKSVPDAEQADFSTKTPGQWLISQVPWSTAEHRISAMAATPETAAMLGLSDRAACLVVERRTWSTLGPVTQVRFTYPGESHALVARFTPASK